MSPGTSVLRAGPNYTIKKTGIYTCLFFTVDSQAYFTASCLVAIWPCGTVPPGPPMDSNTGSRPAGRKHTVTGLRFQPLACSVDLWMLLGLPAKQIRGAFRLNIISSNMLYSYRSAQVSGWQLSPPVDTALSTDVASNHILTMWYFGSYLVHVPWELIFLLCASLE